MEDQTIVVLWAITMVTILEAIALMLEIDGALLTSIISTIVGLVGYGVGRTHEKRMARSHPKKGVEAPAGDKGAGA